MNSNELMRMIEQSRRSKLTLFIDENISSVEEPLRLLGYKVYSLKKGLPDEEIVKLIEGDTIVTRNSKDFLDKAVIFDIDIVDMDSVKFLDKDNSINNITAKLISKVIRDTKYYTFSGNFHIKINNDQTYSVGELK